MTIDEIEALTDEEWQALPRNVQASAMETILESLSADGLAYKGDDGRWRMREDVVVQEIAPDQVTVTRKAEQ